MSRIAYLRVSTDTQCLARQEAMAKRVDAARIFRDKLSGKNADRPALKRMLDYVREGDTLYVESISRLARSVRDLLSIVDKLREKGVNFVSEKEAIDTSTPQGRFVLTLFGALAELERESILQRQREGIDAAREAGVHIGRPYVQIPDGIERDFAEVKAKKKKINQVMKLYGIRSRTTCYKWYNAYLLDNAKR